MKTIEKSILVGFLLTIIFSCFGFFSKCEHINHKILRLHILANSNSEIDQNIKLRVRDKILEFSKNTFQKTKNKEDAKCYLNENLEKIKHIAENEIKKQGNSYPVKVELKETYFTTRQYENLTLPAGKYDAVRVLIGEAQGKNWWCIMFPALCLGASSKIAEPALETVLDTEETDIIENEDKYEFKFKIVEIINDLKNWIDSIFDLD